MIYPKRAAAAAGGGATTRPRRKGLNNMKTKSDVRMLARRRARAANRAEYRVARAVLAIVAVDGHETDADRAEMREALDALYSVRTETRPALDYLTQIAGVMLGASNARDRNATKWARTELTIAFAAYALEKMLVRFGAADERETKRAKKDLLAAIATRAARLTPAAT